MSSSTSPAAVDADQRAFFHVFGHADDSAGEDEDADTLDWGSRSTTSKPQLLPEKLRKRFFGKKEGRQELRKAIDLFCHQHCKSCVIRESGSHSTIIVQCPYRHDPDKIKNSWNSKRHITRPGAPPVAEESHEVENSGKDESKPDVICPFRLVGRCHKSGPVYYWVVEEDGAQPWHDGERCPSTHFSPGWMIQDHPTFQGEMMKPRKQRVNRPALIKALGSGKGNTVKLNVSLKQLEYAERQHNANRNSGLEASIQRTKLAEHEAGCGEREVECEKSEETMKAREKQDHDEEECEMAEVKCPEGCEAKMLRKDLYEHEQHCPEAVVSCAFAEHGCQVRAKRRKIGEHENKAARTHAELAANHAKELKRELEGQKKLAEDRNKFLESQKQLLAALVPESRDVPVTWKIEGFTAKAKRKARLVSKTFSVWTRVGEYKLKLQLEFFRRPDSTTQGFIGVYIHRARGDSRERSDFPVGLGGTRFTVQKGEKKEEQTFPTGSLMPYDSGFGCFAFCTLDKIPGLVWDITNRTTSVPLSTSVTPPDITDFLEDDVLTVSASVCITPPAVVISI